MQSRTIESGQYSVFPGKQRGCDILQNPLIRWSCWETGFDSYFAKPTCNCFWENCLLEGEVGGVHPGGQPLIRKVTLRSWQRLPQKNLFHSRQYGVKRVRILLPEIFGWDGKGQPISALTLQKTPRYSRLLPWQCLSLWYHVIEWVNSLDKAEPSVRRGGKAAGLFEETAELPKTYFGMLGFFILPSVSARAGGF
jgi:hypothetical protein